MRLKKTEAEAIYSRAYGLGYAAGRKRADLAAELARPAAAPAPSPAPAPQIATTVSAGFDMPGGRRITVQFPPDATADELDFFEEALAQYLALFRRRLAAIQSPA